MLKIKGNEDSDIIELVRYSCGVEVRVNGKEIVTLTDMGKLIIQKLDAEEAVILEWKK